MSSENSLKPTNRTGDNSHRLPGGLQSTAIGAATERSRQTAIELKRPIERVFRTRRTASGRVEGPP